MKKALVILALIYTSFVKAQSLGQDASTDLIPTQHKIINSIIYSIPKSLIPDRLNQFPEVDGAQLINKIYAGYTLTPKFGIIQKGKPQIFDFDKDQNVIYWDPYVFDQTEKSDGGEVRIEASVFHALLGLMGLENQDDFSISNRFLVLNNSRKLIAYSQPFVFYPKTADSNEILFFTKSLNLGQIMIVFCGNRDDSSSCRIVGNRSFSFSEVQQLINKKLEYWEGELKNYSADKKALSSTADGVLRAAILAGFIFFVKKLINSPESVFGISNALMVMVGVGIFIIASKGEKVEKNFDISQHKVNSFEQLSDLINNKVNVGDLEKIVKELELFFDQELGKQF